MSWKTETLGSLLTESRIPCEDPDIEKRIRVKLNVQGVEKRPVGAEKEGATKQFVRKAGQFIYGKQNFHKGAFGVIPEELDGFETSADIPSFDVREDCLPEWIYYFFKAGNRYLELTEFARGVGSQRIHPKQLQDLEIPLPPIDIQRKIISELEIIERDEISTELTHQLELLKQLRQAFLREAMQGKLVPQDENDEPASVLLEKIKAEKECLIKEGKIKKQKPLPPITEDEIPFEIPDNWVWCRLGEIIDFFNGKAHEQSVSEFGEFILVTSKFVSTNGEKYRRVKARLTPLSTNDIAFVMSDVPNGIALARTYYVENDKSYTLNQRIGGLRPINGIYPRWLCYVVDRNQYFLDIDDGKKQTNLRKDQILTCPICLPPLSEQQRIVAKLDELMAYCEELEASIKVSKQQNELLLQQVLREALEPK